MYINPIIESKIETTLLFSILSAGVILEVSSTTSSGSVNNLGSTSTISSLLGNIAIFNKGTIIKSPTTIKIFIGENKVWLVGIASVTTPAVCFANPSPPLASCNGIEPDNPPCHTKNPV